jgi:hypothetical protein
VFVGQRNSNALRFELNVPIEANLQSEDGVIVAGRYGDRVLYTLTDNRTMFVAPYVAKRISELGIRAGEPFKICKRYVKNGRSKTVLWLVERFDADGETQLARDLQASIDIANSRNEDSAPEPTPPSDPPTPVTALPRRVTKASDLPAKARTPVNGSANGHSTPSPASDDGKQSAPDTQLAHALKTAIAAAVEAEKFAKTLDYNIRFTTDDVRSMGITILIGMQQRVRN